MFKGREDAALKLSQKLKQEIKRENLIILSLTRGGLVIGKIISNNLNLPLDILVLKKIGDPKNNELAIGVVGPKNITVWNKDVLSFLSLNEKEKNMLKKQTEKERKKQETLFRRGKGKLGLKNKTIILVDDGIATGATVLCAQKYLKKEKTKKIILAIPVIAKDTLSYINKYFDNIIYLKKASKFFAVGQFYKNFPQITNEQVVDLML